MWGLFSLAYGSVLLHCGAIYSDTTVDWWQEKEKLREHPNDIKGTVSVGLTAGTVCSAHVCEMDLIISSLMSARDTLSENALVMI